LKYPEPCRFGQLRDELLDSETALLLYFTGEKYSFGFLATQSGVDMVPLPSAKIIGPWIFNYIQFLTLSNPPEFLGEKAGRKLYQLLIAPLEKRLTGSIKRLVILPDGILHYLPFETLISDSENRRPGQGAKKDRPWRFLIEDFEVSYALSASYLMRLLKRHRPDPRNMDLLAVANPEALHQKDIIWSKAILPPLAYAKKEIQTIAEYFPKKKRRLLIEEEAAEERIKELRLSDFAVLHFASHGFFDDESWWRSALILDHDNRSSEDGLLQPRDILGLYLNADLVVLSACETGKGKIETGEGLMSQAQAFFFAGARSLVTSVWNINDRSTAEFMRHFYSHLIQGSTKGQALRLAKLEMLNSEYSHPFFWAAFLLMGEYKSPLKIPFLN
jgi:CHAT domain-containing protein